MNKTSFKYKDSVIHDGDIVTVVNGTAKATGRITIPKPYDIIYFFSNNELFYGTFPSNSECTPDKYGYAYSWWLAHKEDFPTSIHFEDIITDNTNIDNYELF